MSLRQTVRRTATAALILALPTTLVATTGSAAHAGTWLPDDYVAPAGWVWYAHQYPSFSLPSPGASEALIWEKKRAGLVYPDANTKVAEGETVTPQPYCHPDDGNGEDLIKAYTVPAQFTMQYDGQRVRVVCVYGYYGGDESQPLGWSREFGIRLAASQEPSVTKLEAPTLLEVGASTSVSVEVAPRARAGPACPRASSSCGSTAT